MIQEERISDLSPQDSSTSPSPKVEFNQTAERVQVGDPGFLLSAKSSVCVP